MPHRIFASAIRACVLLSATTICRAGPRTHPLELGDPRIGPPDNPNSINSGTASISRTGMFVVFHCYASNLVPQDTNGLADVFVWKRRSAEVERVSVRMDGAQANGTSTNAGISATGRYVVFQSTAGNLVDNDTNNRVDVFVHDRATRWTRRVSVSSYGVEGNLDSTHAALSANGRYVVFTSNATNLVPNDLNDRLDVFVHDTLARVTRCVSLNAAGLPANNDSQLPSMSDDGRFVAFESKATDLAPGDTNGTWDIYVRDLLTETTTRASLAADGAEGNAFSMAASLSADGRYVAFISGAANLVPGDTNGMWDCFVRDRLTGSTVLASVAGEGAQGNERTHRCRNSADGRRVVFRSLASNLVPGDSNLAWDVFVRDLTANTTTRVSVNAFDQEANDDSYDGALSADNHSLVFVSEATNLNAGALDPDVYRVFVCGPRPPSLGDINEDGQVDGRDIQPLVAALLGPAIPLQLYRTADFNGDGVIDWVDVWLMVDCLANGRCP